MSTAPGRGIAAGECAGLTQYPLPDEDVALVDADVTPRMSLSLPAVRLKLWQWACPDALTGDISARNGRIYTDPLKHSWHRSPDLQYGTTRQT